MVSLVVSLVENNQKKAKVGVVRANNFALAYTLEPPFPNPGYRAAKGEISGTFIYEQREEVASIATSNHTEESVCLDVATDNTDNTETKQQLCIIRTAIFFCASNINQ